MPRLKINNIKAKGFMSFGDIEINDFDEGINFIIEPNG